MRHLWITEHWLGRSSPLSPRFLQIKLFFELSISSGHLHLTPLLFLGWRGTLSWNRELSVPIKHSGSQACQGQGPPVHG